MTQERIRVLLIEHESGKAASFDRAVANLTLPPIEMTHVESLAAGLDRLAASRFDVVMLSLDLPDGAGVANLHRLKAVAPHVPVILLMNRDDEEAAIASLADGAQDYLLKRDVTSELVHRVIRSAVWRQTAETSLRVREARYSLAVAGTRDGIWDWDLARNEIHLSARWFQLLHLQGSDMVATPDAWFALVHEDDRAGLKAALEAHLAGETPYLEHEFRMRSGDGETVWVLCRGMAVRDATGRATRVAGALTDISHRKRAEARLAHEALHDPLTGLPNRTLFLDRLGLALKQQRRDPRRNFGVLFLDLDRFKSVNDSHGHAVGDEVLVEFGRRLTMFLRPGDSIARLSGDEFAILLADITGGSEAARVAERIHDLLSLKFVVGDKEIYVSASIGIVISDLSYETPGELLRDADVAMYRSKNGRTGSYVLFHRFMHDLALRRLDLETDLRWAASRSELVNYYQPIVSLDGRQVIGVEALLRWFHPSRGLIGPDVFIPIAEKSALIGSLSWWAMQDACRQAREWQQSDAFANLAVSVNVSSCLFAEPDFAGRTAAVLEETGLRPELLHLDLTERALLQHESAAIRELTALRGIGVKIHLDDFGTGYSSLTHLSRFKYDTIKIDRSLVAALSGASGSRRIIDAMIGLADVLNVAVVAEGVETERQVQELRDVRCRGAQGFLFSRPLPAELFGPMLRREWGIGRGAAALSE
jgi:diguanylate cyclase (GGDEF)-like protein/PAS domain S-box-containing protein